MKKYIYLFLIFWSCNIIENKSKDIKNFIPVNSSVIIKIDNLGKFKSDIKNNKLLDDLSKSDLKYNFKKQIKLINNFQDESQIIICLNENEKIFTIITKDSSNNHDLHFRKIGDVNIFSNSSSTIKSIKEQANTEYNKYNKTFNTSSSFGIILNKNLSKNLINSTFNFKDLNLKNNLGFVVNVFNDKILLNGLSYVDDSTKISNNIFDGLTSTKLKNYEIVPKNVSRLKSFNLSSYSNYKKNSKLEDLKEDRLSSIINENLIEYSELILNEDQLFIIRLKDIQLFKDYLSENNNIKSTHRNFNIYDNTFLDYKLTNSVIKYNYKKKILVFKNHIVFSDNETTLIEFINENLKGNTLQEDSSFNNSLIEISSFNTLNNNYFTNSDYNFFKELNILNSKNDFTENSFQLVQDNEIIHFNAIISKAKASKNTLKISKQFEVEIDEEILMNPHFIKNYATKKLDIVVQDKKNNLYLISNKGSVVWKRKIGQPILGKISQIDLYKNGRLQLIFNTKNKVFVLDRNGKEVKPFPKSFNDDITQPISIFDYDKNKNYRILVTQGKELLLYDKNGKKVNGFKYSRSNSKITSSPKHFRILNKDFIVFKTGKKLKILNRRGRERIKLKDEVVLSNENIFKLDNKLITITNDQKLVEIDISGTVSLSNLLNSKNLKLNTDNYNNIIILDENKMRLNSSYVDLPFSNYNTPKLTKINNNLFVSLFDSQNNKSYLFNKNLQPNSSFPIYSLIPTEFGDMNNDKKIHVIASKITKTISIYTID
tara:strand:- start:1994 stop:4303 length:2310 start_codon:yes stop_codon:yes gene_type:complete